MVKAAKPVAKRKPGRFAGDSLNERDNLVMLPGRERCVYCSGAVVPSEPGALVTADQQWMHVRCYRAADGREPSTAA